MFYIFWLWKAWNTIAGSVFGTMLLKLWGVRLHGIVKCVGLPRLEIDPKGKVYVGRHVCLRSARCSNIAGVFQPVSIGTLEGGRIELGDGCGISGSTLVASREIRIGKNVLIGAGCRILDCDFHPVSAEARIHGGKGKCAPVILEDGVWLAAGVTVLKGVTIGRNTVVGAGSVVVKPLPENVLAAGNPAKPIGVIRRKEPQIIQTKNNGSIQL